MTQSFKPTLGVIKYETEKPFTKSAKFYHQTCYVGQTLTQYYVLTLGRFACKCWTNVVLVIGRTVVRPLAASHLPTFSQCRCSVSPTYNSGRATLDHCWAKIGRQPLLFMEELFSSVISPIARYCIDAL